MEEYGANIKQTRRIPSLLSSIDITRLVETAYHIWRLDDNSRHG